MSGRCHPRPYVLHHEWTLPSTSSLRLLQLLPFPPTLQTMTTSRLAPSPHHVSVPPHHCSVINNHSTSHTALLPLQPSNRHPHLSLTAPHISHCSLIPHRVVSPFSFFLSHYVLPPGRSRSRAVVAFTSTSSSFLFHTGPLSSHATPTSLLPPRHRILQHRVAGPQHQGGQPRRGAGRQRDDAHDLGLIKEKLVRSGGSRQLPQLTAGEEDSGGALGVKQKGPQSVGVRMRGGVRALRGRGLRRDDLTAGFTPVAVLKRLRRMACASVDEDAVQRPLPVGRSAVVPLCARGGVEMVC